jgi:hypothetical protein
MLSRDYHNLTINVAAISALAAIASKKYIKTTDNYVRKAIYRVSR